MTSALAMSAGVSSGSRNSGSSSSRIRACEEMAAKTVPPMPMAALPNAWTATNPAQQGQNLQVIKRGKNGQQPNLGARPKADSNAKLLLR